MDMAYLWHSFESVHSLIEDDKPPIKKCLLSNLDPLSLSSNIITMNTVSSASCRNTVCLYNTPCLLYMGLPVVNGGPTWWPQRCHACPISLHGVLLSVSWRQLKKKLLLLCFFQQYLNDYCDIQLIFLCHLADESLQTGEVRGEGSTSLSTTATKLLSQVFCVIMLPVL